MSIARLQTPNQSRVPASPVPAQIPPQRVGFVLTASQLRSVCGGSPTTKWSTA